MIRYFDKLRPSLPVLETPRLLLRQMERGDTADMYEYARLHETTRYLLWSPHPSPEYTRAYLTMIGRFYRKGEFFDWAIVEKESGRMIGTCGFTSLDFVNNCAEVGYVLNPDYQGKGLATEAVRRVLTFGFEELGLHRIEARFIQGNTASLRLMGRVGMTFEGYARESMRIKGRYRTIGTCAILRQEFLKGK